MLDELQSTAGGAGLAADATPASQPVLSGESKPVVSRLEAILAKKSSGGKLTPAESGYLGSIRRKQGTPFAATASPSSSKPATANADNPLFASETSNNAATQAPAAPAVDSALLRSTANSILSSVDTVTKLYVGYEAKKAGADAATIAEYKTAVALQADNRQLIVENSEPMVLAACEMLGCTPDKLTSVLKNSGFFGGIIAHGLGVVTAIKSIKESQRELAAKKQEEKKL